MSIVEMEDASCVGLSVVVVDDSIAGWIMEDKLFGNEDSGIKRGDLHTSRVVTEDESEPCTNAAVTRRMTVETTICELCRRISRSIKPTCILSRLGNTHPRCIRQLIIMSLLLEVPHPIGEGTSLLG
jgi:hypothetical protein